MDDQPALQGDAGRPLLPASIAPPTWVLDKVDKFCVELDVVISSASFSMCSVELNWDAITSRSLSPPARSQPLPASTSVCGRVFSIANGLAPAGMSSGMPAETSDNLPARSSATPVTKRLAPVAAALVPTEAGAIAPGSGSDETAAICALLLPRVWAGTTRVALSLSSAS